MTALLALSLPLDLVEELLAFLPESAALLAMRVVNVWWALAASLILVRLTGMGRLAGVLSFASLLILVVLPLAATRQVLWSPPVDEAKDSYDKKYDALTSEDVFYRQPKLLDRALGNLSKQRKERAELYFIGLAGDAEQGVFLREVKAVEKLLDERFGISGHAISLINNYPAALDYPLASVTALEQSLKRVGGLMDRNKDILLLFISSHGSPDHSIVLDFWPIRFNPLNPEVLRRILDESEIYWRVVVVSACYSGGFIEPLSDAHTIVITAPAPDRSSFGCSDENEWTDFGKAFFDEALRHESDLAKAFEEARKTIVRREREEQVEIESDPRIFVGSAMAEKWRSFVGEANLQKGWIKN